MQAYDVTNDDDGINIQFYSSPEDCACENDISVEQATRLRTPVYDEYAPKMKPIHYLKEGLWYPCESCFKQVTDDEWVADENGDVFCGAECLEGHLCAQEHEDSLKADLREYVEKRFSGCEITSIRKGFFGNHKCHTTGEMTFLVEANREHDKIVVCSRCHAAWSIPYEWSKLI